ncbi:MAG: hypothetical protein IH991_24430, partial [Planctomycetes bacterium]|nr:hypothetical protein [Planctomycetota bacterium]
MMFSRMRQGRWIRVLTMAVVFVVLAMMAGDACAEEADGGAGPIGPTGGTQTQFVLIW